MLFGADKVSNKRHNPSFFGGQISRAPFLSGKIIGIFVRSSKSERHGGYPSKRPEHGGDRFAQARQVSLAQACVHSESCGRRRCRRSRGRVQHTSGIHHDGQDGPRGREDFRCRRHGRSGRHGRHQSGRPEPVGRRHQPDALSRYREQHALHRGNEPDSGPGKRDALAGFAVRLCGPRVVSALVESCRRSPDASDRLDFLFRGRRRGRSAESLCAVPRAKPCPECVAAQNSHLRRQENRCHHRDGHDAGSARSGSSSRLDGRQAGSVHVRVPYRKGQARSGLYPKPVRRGATAVLRGSAALRPGRGRQPQHCTPVGASRIGPGCRTSSSWHSAFTASWRNSSKTRKSKCRSKCPASRSSSRHRYPSTGPIWENLSYFLFSFSSA